MLSAQEVKSIAQRVLAIERVILRFSAETERLPRKVTRGVFRCLQIDRNLSEMLCKHDR
jgi:hypothetical protein